MIELFIYFVVGIVVGMLFMRLFKLRIETMDGPDNLMVGAVVIFWPGYLIIGGIAGIGRLPGKIIYWFENWRNAQYERMEEKE